MSQRRRVRQLARFEAGKDLPTRTQAAEIGTALGVPGWAFLLESDEFHALIKGEWPSREAIALARARFAQLDP